MTGRRAIVGLCMLCALLVSAFAAQSASAVSGTTAFTCKSVTPAVGTKGFSKEHCKTADAVETNASFEHFAINQDTTTELEITNKNTSDDTSTSVDSILAGVVATVPIELKSTEVHGTGSLKNEVDPTKEHFIHAKEVVLKYTKVTEGLAGCTVTGMPGGAGTVETKKLTATTTGAGHSLTFKPEVGTEFAKFVLGGVGCKVPGTYTVNGTITCKPSGATITCNHKEVTDSKTLRLGGAGPFVGLDGRVTVKGKDPSIGGDTFKPLSVTTVETV